MLTTNSTILFALIALLSPAAASLRAEDRMRPGLWDVATTIDGKPQGTTTTCYTPEMVRFANSSSVTLREMTEKRNARFGCTLKEFKQDAHVLSMINVCGAKTAEIVSTYSVDAFETVDKSTTAGVTNVTRMKGRRTGDCK